MGLLSNTAVPVALVAIVIASLTAHSRLVVHNKPRTVLAGNIFEDTRNRTGIRYKLNSVDSEQTSFDALVRRGTPGALPGKSASPPMHAHKRQTECFMVREGVLGYTADGTAGTVDSSQVEPLCIPPGVPHTYWNAKNDTDLRHTMTLQPADNSEAFFRTIAGLGQDYGGLQNVNPFQLLATFVEAGVVLTDLPKPMQWAVEHVLVPHFIVPVLGFKPFPPEYTSA